MPGIHHLLPALKNIEKLSDALTATQFESEHQAAFLLLYQTSYRAVYTYALRLTRSAEDAQDITQEVFLKIWKNRKQLAGVQSLRAYLFGICKNASLNLLARSAREKAMAAEWSQNPGFTNQPGPPESTDEQYIQLLHQALGHLPPRRRQVFCLCKIHGKTHGEVARQLGIGKGTINDHIVKATRAIRKFLYLCGSFQEI